MSERFSKQRMDAMVETVRAAYSPEPPSEIGRLRSALSLIREGEINGHDLARADLVRLAREALDIDNG